MAIMEGSSPQAKLEKSYLSGLKANWLLWPVVQAANFKLVPLEYRVLVVNFVSIGKRPNVSVAFLPSFAPRASKPRL